MLACSVVVGGDAQAIYGFRAASAEHILSFPDHFPDATTVTLERNYRSTQPILDLANEVSARAARSYRKRLHADREGGLRPLLVYCRDENQQAGEVCDRVLAGYEQAIALKQQAVLMRAGHHSRELELELTRRKIPFVKYGGIRYLEAAHIKDFLCLLRLADNLSDQLAWFRLLQLLEGVGPVPARRAVDALEVATLGSASELEQRWPTVAPLLNAPARETVGGVIGALIAAGGEEAGRRAGRSAPGRNRPRDPRPLPRRLRPAARSRPTGRCGCRGGEPERLPGRACPRSALLQRRLRRPTTPGRGLPGAQHRPLRQRAGMGRRPPDRRQRRQLPLRHGTHHSRRPGRRTTALLCRTRPRQTLTIYSPVRYYHRPTGNDDAHGYGKHSRFLTEHAETLCETTNLHHDHQPPAPSSPTGSARVEVDLSRLWQ